MPTHGAGVAHDWRNRHLEAALGPDRPGPAWLHHCLAAPAAAQSEPSWPSRWRCRDHHSSHSPAAHRSATWWATPGANPAARWWWRSTPIRSSPAATRRRLEPPPPAGPDHQHGIRPHGQERGSSAAAWAGKWLEQLSIASPVKQGGRLSQRPWHRPAQTDRETARQPGGCLHRGDGPATATIEATADSPPTAPPGLARNGDADQRHGNHPDHRGDRA